eukprot:3750426-Amphidinium_carterae.1
MYFAHEGVKTGVVYGGTPIAKDVEMLKACDHHLSKYRPTMANWEDLIIFVNVWDYSASSLFGEDAIASNRKRPNLSAISGCKAVE